MLKTFFPSKSRMVCSICSARALISKPARPFDACGFERCEFECRHCGAYFVGIVDPLDGANVVSADTPNGTFYQVIPRNKDAQPQLRSLSKRVRANHTSMKVCFVANADNARIQSKVHVADVADQHRLSRSASDRKIQRQGRKKRFARKADSY
jgi:hypothetical protein